MDEAGVLSGEWQQYESGNDVEGCMKEDESLFGRRADNFCQIEKRHRQRQKEKDAADV